MRVVVGLSGGVDSSVAAYLLKEQGYDVVGLFMRNWKDTTGTLEGDCPWYDDHMFAELVAKRLDIPFHLIDLSDEYRRRVVDYMFAEYGRGRTPNPDVLCNREIKFDAFLKAALDLGADYVATGHYCRREDVEIDGRTVHRLLAGSDPNKDQSYFLCQLTQRQLSRALFPIGHLLKPEVRRIAAEQHLATAARKDSQGICFVGKVDLPVFLQQWLEAREGDIVEVPASWDGYRPLADGATLDELAAPYAYRETDGTCVGRHRGGAFLHDRAAQGPERRRQAGAVVRDCDGRGAQRAVRRPGTATSGTLPARVAHSAGRDALGTSRPGVAAGRERAVPDADTLPAAVAGRRAACDARGRVYRVRRAAARRYGRAVRLVVRRRGIDRIGGDSLLRQVRPADAGRVKRSGERPKTLPAPFCYSALSSSFSALRASYRAFSRPTFFDAGLQDAEQVGVRTSVSDP